MLMHHWIMLSSLILYYFFALVLCPRNSWGVPVRHTVMNSARRSRTITLGGGISYSLNDDTTDQASSLAKFGYYQLITERQYRRKLRIATQKLSDFFRREYQRLKNKSLPRELIYTHIFKEFDLNNDQNISRKEFDTYLHYLGINGSRRRHGRRKRKRKHKRRRRYGG